MLVGNQVVVGLTRRTRRFLFPVKEQVNYAPHGSESPVLLLGMDNPTNQDGLLLKHQLSPAFPV